MDFTTVLFAGAVCALWLLVSSKGWRTWRRMSAVPGPRAFPVVGTAYQVAFLQRKDFMPRFREITTHNWPMFRTWVSWRPEVHVCTGPDMEVVMTNSELIDKSDQYRLLMPWLGEGLLTSGGAKWHTRRKLLTPTFHFKILDSFIDIFAEKSQILIEQLSSTVDAGTFDIYPFITQCALDIICETAMGTNVNAQRNAESEYVSAVNSAIEITSDRILKPWLYFDFIFRRTSTGKKFYRDLKFLHGFSRKVIRERRMQRLKQPNGRDTAAVDDFGRKKRVAFLDLLLDVCEGSQKLTDDEIQEEVDTFMFEGHDTTSVAMSWALVLLGLHPDVQNKVYEELKDIFGASDRQPTMQDLQNMKYLEMVIKETLRLYPSVPFIARRVEKNIEIRGYKIPPGVTAVLHIYDCHRDPDVWPDPEGFDPDNFLPDRVQGRHPFAYVPFSGGSRNCIGQKFAMLEEKTVLSYIIRNYKVETAQDMRRTDLVGELILRPLGPVKVRLSRR